jgi:hypothetical protein
MPEPMFIEWHLMPSQQLTSIPPISLSLCDPFIIARQWLGKNFTVATNTHATIGELLGVLFSVLPVSYQGKVDDWFFLELLILLYTSTSKYFQYSQKRRDASKRKAACSFMT